MKEKFTLNIPITGRVKACLELLKKQKVLGKVVVDVGSSSGWLENEILSEQPKEIIGVEPNKKAVLFAINAVKKARFLVGDALKIPIKSNYADIVALFDVIEHLPKGKEESALGEINRVLKKGGVLLLSTPNYNFLTNIFDPAWYFGHRHYQVENITKLLGNAGFKILQKGVRGGAWSLVYMVWFYVTKWILGKKSPRNVFLEKMDDRSYLLGSRATLFIVAQKI